jgi:hypothetical protein
MLLVMLPVAVLAVPAAAAAAPKDGPAKYDVRHFTCPLGGKPFDQDVGYSSFPLITLPDGSWLGDFMIDAQIPVCPDNGLVILPDYEAMRQQDSQKILYHDYTPAERARLVALVADPAYVALKADGRHAQAYWLATQLGRPALDRFALLQRATWAARPAALRRRLVERLATDGPALIDAIDAPDAVKRAHLYYIINALRELGRFDDALALLEKVEASGPPVHEPVDPDSMYGPEEYAPKVRLALAERDDGRFPVEVLSDRMVNDVCNGELVVLFGQPSATTIAACKTRRDREARASAEMDAAFTESAALKQKPEELVASCAATPEEKRGKGLAMACDGLQRDRDEAAGAVLAKDGPKLAATCEATPEADQKGALRFGCSSYRIVLESELGSAIANDKAAWAILCPGGGDATPDDRDRHVAAACMMARGERDMSGIVAGSRRLAAAPPKVEIKCPTDQDADGATSLFIACPSVGWQKRYARIRLLENDDAVFAHDCAHMPPPKPRPTSAQDQVFFDLEEAVDDGSDVCRDAYDFRENRKAEAAGKANGLMCWPGSGRERPRCVLPADYAAEEARTAQEQAAQRARTEMLDHDSSLSIEARARAAALIASAKVAGTYPKRRPGERE